MEGHLHLRYIHIDFPQFMRAAPFLRMLELGVCRDYYKHVDPRIIGPGGEVSEKLCKLREIQTSLACIKGVAGATGILPGQQSPNPWRVLC